MTLLNCGPRYAALCDSDSTFRFPGELRIRTWPGSVKPLGVSALARDGSQMRIVGAAHFLPAGRHLHDAAPMVAVLRIQAADDRQIGASAWPCAATTRKHARRAPTWDRAKGPARVRIRLGIPRFQLTHSAVQEDVEDPLAARLELIGDRRRTRDEPAHAQRRSRRSQRQTTEQARRLIRCSGDPQA